MVVNLAPFSRPAYLDQSALRYLLHTGIPQLPSSPKPELSHADYSAGGRRSQRSPSFDSDEEDMSHSGELSSQQETILMSPAPLRLPTRWSDEYRNPLLSVSADGRDLTYQGQFIVKTADLRGMSHSLTQDLQETLGKVPQLPVRSFLSLPPVGYITTRLRSPARQVALRSE